MTYSISLLSNKNNFFNKNSVKRFYKAQHYSARFIGFDRCFIYRELDTQIKGAVIVSAIEKQYFLHALVTISDLRRQGIGSKLVEHCKRDFDHLICFADIKLTKFYLKLGFNIEHENLLCNSLLIRWHSYHKKNSNLLIFSFKKNDG